MMWIILIAAVGLAAAKVAVEPEYLDQLLAEGRDEEFAKLMGISVDFVRPKEERSEGFVMTMVSPLGDILLPSEEGDEQARQGINFERYGGSRWPKDEIPYVISSSYSRRQRAAIQSAIDDFNSKVQNLQLVKRGRQKDYVMVFSGEGCYSYLGRTGGQQPVSLQSNGCVYKNTVQHEFMHAAGIIHEHNRPDRDEHVTVLDGNIPKKWKNQYEKVDATEYNVLGAYDYLSIMHYPLEAPDSQGKPAFEVKEPGFDATRLGQSADMTQTDIGKINTLYA